MIGVFGSSGSTSGRGSFSRKEPLPTLAAAAATVTGVVQAAAPPPQQEMIPLASATTRADVSLDAVSLALLAQPGDEGVSSEHTQADAAEGPSAAAAALRIDDGSSELDNTLSAWLEVAADDDGNEPLMSAMGAGGKRGGGSDSDDDNSSDTSEIDGVDAAGAPAGLS